MQPIDPVPDTLTFAILLTAAGAGIAAGIITALVELIKSALPTVAQRFTGAFLAFVLSAILYVLAGIAVGVSTLDAGLVVFVAWITAATSAVGIHSTIRTARGG